MSFIFKRQAQHSVLAGTKRAQERKGTKNEKGKNEKDKNEKGT
ncbi:MAG TPA: hypothetical protein VMM54_09060 [Nitrospirota bacterium]|nr:hypothetical protein [Nitrospirota bacterium]